MRRHPALNAPYDLQLLGTILHAIVLMTLLGKLALTICVRLFANSVFIPTR